MTRRYQTLEDVISERYGHRIDPDKDAQYRRRFGKGGKGYPTAAYRDPVTGRRLEHYNPGEGYEHD